MIESIIDFVFDNLFIVIIVIAIVSNLFRSSKKTRNQNETTESDRSSSAKEPESLESKIERNLKKFGNVPEEEKETVKERVPTSQPVEKSMSSIDEEHKKQREALANRYQTNTQTNKKDEPEQKAPLNAPSVISHHNKKSGISKKGLEKRTSEKGLKESIVMAEVLGKPRALKPYKSGRAD